MWNFWFVCLFVTQLAESSFTCPHRREWERRKRRLCLQGTSLLVYLLTCCLFVFFFRLFVCLFVCSFFCLFVCLFVRLFIDLLVIVLLPQTQILQVMFWYIYIYIYKYFLSVDNAVKLWLQNLVYSLVIYHMIVFIIFYKLFSFFSSC